MEALVQVVPNIRRKPLGPVTIHTTLYDLIASINEEVGPDENRVVTATVVHLLNTYRVTYTEQPLKGYRIVCDDQGRSVRLESKAMVCLSQNERGSAHFDIAQCQAEP